MALLSSPMKLPAGRPDIIAALDVGSTKVTCFIAQVTEKPERLMPEIRVLGIGHQGAQGVRSGAIIDMEAAEDAIRASVEQAEQMAGREIHRAWLNITSPSLLSRRLSEEIMLSNGDVSPGDTRRVLRDAHMRAHSGTRETLHAIPMGYSVDGSKGIKDPTGMLGDTLSVSLNEITMDPGPLRNLGVCVERAYLEPERTIYSAYASSMGALVEDEMDLGVTLIELGGGTTSIASFFGGRMIFAKTIALGGIHVTHDIARGLSTPVADAERIKAMFGSLLASPNDDREMIHVPPIGEEDPRGANQVPRSMLVNIIKPRVEETFEFIRDALVKTGVERVAGHRIVLTGGASQLTGLPDYAGRFFDAHVRIGRATGLSGLPEAATGPAFATAGGLLTYPYRAPDETTRAGQRNLGGMGLGALMGLIGLGRRGQKGRNAA